nr:ribonuclease H-like domain-containing protein [Tanacetum cinerariifolium]
ELIRLQNQINVDSEIAKEMVSRMNYVIDARSDCLKGGRKGLAGCRLCSFPGSSIMATALPLEESLGGVNSLGGVGENLEEVVLTANQFECLGEFCFKPCESVTLSDMKDVELSVQVLNHSLAQLSLLLCKLFRGGLNLFLKSSGDKSWKSGLDSILDLMNDRIFHVYVGNKMHKAFPLPVIEFSLPDEVPTSSEESSHCQKKREAIAVKIALLLKSRRNCQSKSDDSYTKTVTVIAEDMQKRKNDVKARTTLLLSLPDEHQLRFTEGLETLEQTFNRLQVIVGQLLFVDVEIEQDDLNQKFLTSLAPEWLMHTIKKLKTNSQNMAFISSAKHSRGNEDVHTASVSTASTNVPTASANIGVASISQDTACAYIASQSSSSQIKFEDINQIDEDDMEDMNIKWNMALLSMRADKWVTLQGSAGLPEAKTEEGETTTDKEFALMANTSAESKVFDNSLCSKDRKKNTDSLNTSKDLDSLLESQRLDKNKEGLGYSDVPLLPAQIYSSPKKDMSWTGLPEFKDDTVTDYSRPAPTVESSPDDAQNRNPSVTEEASPSTISPKSFIKFMKANDSLTNSKTYKAETAKKPPVKKRVKKRTSRSQNNTHKSFTPRPAIHKPYRPPMRPMRSNMNGARPNKTSFNKPAHSYPNRPFQRTSAARSQYRALWVPTVNKKFPPVNRKFSTVSRNFSTVNRKFPTANRKFLTGGTKFSTADIGKKGKAVKPSACWFWKPSQNLSNKGPNSNSVSVMFKKYTYIDTQGRLNGCSKHMTGNISYLFKFEPFDGGYVSFGQGGCKITGKGTIKTGKIEFENVYFVKDLNYNLFSMS